MKYLKAFCLQYTETHESDTEKDFNVIVATNLNT